MSLFNIMVNKVKEILNLIIKGRLLVNTLKVEEGPQRIDLMFYHRKCAFIDIANTYCGKNYPEPEEPLIEYKYTINVIGTEICLYNKGNLSYLFIDDDCITISNFDFINLQSLFKQIHSMKDHNKSINKLNAIIDACN